MSCQVLQELGFGLTREIVADVVCSYLKDHGRPSPFTGGIPGAHWWRGFLKRWPKLSERKPQHLSAKRAAAASEETLQSWFTMVQEFFVEKGLLKRRRPVADFASRIWNADESGFCLGTTSKKLLARRGDRSVHEVGGASDRQYITINACGNAAGVRLPPFILYKGKNLYDSWTKGGPAGTVFGTSTSGWMEEANYLSWFQKQFYPAVKSLLETGPVVLFVDGHYSHVSVDLIKTARTLGIHIFCLPPNTTHILQPLDVGVFGPVKQCWRTILKRYKLKTRAANISKQSFPELIAELYELSFTAEHLKGGFRAAGLVPFNPHIHRSRPARFAPSLPTINEGDFERTHTTPATETPLRTELRVYFSKVLKPADQGPRQRRRKINVHCVGEVLTSDEVLERLEQADAEKASKKKGRKKKSTRGTQQDATRCQQPASASIEQSSRSKEPEVYCGGCRQTYTDAESESWVGCDTCDSWWHYWCAGFESMPEEEDEWVCELCQ